MQSDGDQSKQLQLRPIGASQYNTGPIGLGCVTFGREIDESTSWRILDYAVQHGITLLDTAESYGGGSTRKARDKRSGRVYPRKKSNEMCSSEHILGRWLQARRCRNQVTLCTKVSSGNSPENIHRQIDASLERLGTNYLDIYLLHEPDHNIPIDETLDALHREVCCGRVRVIGSSNFSAQQMREAIDISTARGYTRFQVTQPPYSLIERSAEEELFDLCDHEKVAAITYSPLAAGFLSGKYRYDRASIPVGTRFDVAPRHADLYFTEANFYTAETLRRRADELGIPMVRLAMAWAMNHPSVTAVLIGARTIDHIDNALAASEFNMSTMMRQQLIHTLTSA